MKNLIASLVIWFLVLPSGGETVRLVWDQNPPEDLVQSYIVYEHLNEIILKDTNSPFSLTNWMVKPGGIYQTLLSVPSNSFYFSTNSTNSQLIQTNITAVLSNVIAGPHGYVVTASNFWGESLFSNEAGAFSGAAKEDVPEPPKALRINVWIGSEGTNETAAIGFKFDMFRELVAVEHSTDAVNWHDWLTITQEDPQFLVENFIINVRTSNQAGFLRLDPDL